MIKKLAVVALILFAVGAVFVVIYNPVERLKESRDRKRAADLEKLKKALDFYISKNAKTGASLCDNCQLGESIYSYRQIKFDTKITQVSHTQFVNGTGWIPVDFSLNINHGETPLTLLPIDPLEETYPVRQKLPILKDSFTPEIEDFVYTFTPGEPGKYKLTAKMESKKGLAQAGDDGGNLESRLEVGSDLKLAP